MLALRGSKRLLMMSRAVTSTPSLHPKELQTERYLSLRNQFSKLTVDELALRGLALGKTVFQNDERVEAHALIREVIPKVRHLPYRNLRELLIMTNAASLHQECLELFHAKWEHSENKDASVIPHESVVDSAFALGDVDELLRLAMFARDRLVKYTREVACDFIVWRIVWRLACMCVHADDANNTSKREAAEEAAVRVWESCVKQYHPQLFNSVLEHLLPYDDGGGNFTPNPGKECGASGEISSEAKGAGRKVPIITHPTAPPPLVFAVLDLGQGSTMRKGFSGIFRRMQRIVLYHRVPHGASGDAAASQQLDTTGSESTSTAVTSGGERTDALPDNGEMKFFLFCVQQGLLRFNPRKFLEPPLPEEPPINPGNVEQYYFNLVGSCRRGLYVEQAIQYADEYRSLLEERRTLDAKKAAEEVAAPKPTMLISPNDYNEDNNLLPQTQTTPATASSVNTASGNDADDTQPHQETVVESFIFHVLTVLQAARAHKHTLRFTKPILAETSTLTAALWSQILLAAGEERQVHICRQGFDYAVENLRATSSLAAPALTAPVGSGGHLSQMEYLLQTSLHALAKCHVPYFYETILAPVIEAKHIQLNDETIAYLMTQNSLHAPDAGAEVARTREWMKERRLGLSTRIGSLMMKVLMRVESADMIPLYKELVALARSQKVSGGSLVSANTPAVVFKKIWLEELILCADRRRYVLTQEERRYIIAEVERVFGALHIDAETGKFSSNALEGLRTQIAMIYYDAQHEPLVAFQRWEEQKEREQHMGRLRRQWRQSDDGDEEDVPPLPQPYLSDPRSYFLIRKPHCCTRAVERAAWRQTSGSFVDASTTATSEYDSATEGMTTVSSKRALSGVAETFIGDMLHGRHRKPSAAPNNSLEAKLHDEGYHAMLSTLLDGVQVGARDSADTTQ